MQSLCSESWKINTGMVEESVDHIELRSYILYRADMQLGDRTVVNIAYGGSLVSRNSLFFSLGPIPLLAVVV